MTADGSDDDTDSSNESTRDRGILAPVDREFLAGIKEYNHRQSAHRRRGEIRDRVANGIRDFWLLANELDDRDVAQIADALSVPPVLDESGEEKFEFEHGENFHSLDLVSAHSDADAESAFEGVGTDGVVGSPKGFHRGAVSAIAFLYRLYGDDEVAFESLIAEGARSGIGHSRTGTWSVDVDIAAQRVEEVDVEEVIEKLAAGNHAALTDLEREIVVSRLAEQDALDIEALRESKRRDESVAADDDEDDEE